jgi:ATP-dependent Clp protease ATP-binding subunit ClpA
MLESSADVFDMLLPALKGTQLIMIGMDTADEFTRAFATKPLIAKQFNQINFESPAISEVKDKMRHWVKQAGKKDVDEKFLDHVIATARKYNITENTMGRSIDLLREIYKQMEAKTKGKETPDQEDINLALQSLYKVKPWMLKNADVRAQLVKQESHMETALAGLNAQKVKFSKMAGRTASGLVNGLGVAGSAILYGVWGSGKTAISIEYARGLGVNYKRILLNQYDGMANPYNNLKTEMAAALTQDPYTVFILDELDKVKFRSQVEEVFLDILDSGVFTVQVGMTGGAQKSQKVSARFAQFLFLSNDGAEKIRRRKQNKGKIGDAFQTKEDAKKAQDKAKAISDEEAKEILMASGASRAFLDRMMDFVDFSDPLREEFKRALEIHIRRKIESESLEKDKKITLTEGPLAVFIERLVKENFDGKKEVSYRDLHRIIKDEIDPILKNIYLSDKFEASLGGAVNFCTKAFEALSN